MTEASVDELKRDIHTNKETKPLYIYIEIENVDEKYREIVSLDFQPSSEPKDWPWGNREFALKDPDEHVLVFYTKRYA